MTLLLDRGSLYNPRRLSVSIRCTAMIEPSSGAYLKEVRLAVAACVVRCQHISRKIANSERNKRFYISTRRPDRGRPILPTQFKLFTLATTYGLPFYEILQLFGVDTDFSPISITIKAAGDASHRLRASTIRDRKITFPVRLDPPFKWEWTQLINPAVAIWLSFLWRSFWNATSANTCTRISAQKTTA